MALQIPDQTIALQAKPPDAMQNISGMLNMANSAQALKKSQATFDSDVSQRAAESQTAQAGARVATANVQPLIEQQAANTSSAQTGAQASRFKLTSDQQGVVNQISSGLISDPAINSGDSASMLPIFKAARDRMVDSGVPKEMAEVGYAHLVVAAHNNPGAVPQILRNSILQSQPPTQQSQTIQPNGIAVSNGQQSSVVQTNPFAGQTGQAIPGTGQQQQLPVTTPTMGGPSGTTPGYVGPQGPVPTQAPPPMDLNHMTPDQMTKFRAQAAAQFGLQPGSHPGHSVQTGQGRSFVASGLPAGAAQGITGTQDQINKHWGETQASASTAQQDIGILQNIKLHAPGAATGVEADKQSLVAGIAGMLGMSSGELAKTNADLLSKNSAMLALAGGDTNLARTMAEAATPNSHMTQEAIIQAANQVIGQRKLALARSTFLTPYKTMADQGHPEAYNSAVNAFNSVADPRVIQFKSMSPAEMSAMKGSMSPQEQIEFRAKLGKARDLGIAP